MFFRSTRILWNVTSAITDAAFDLGYTDKRLSEALMNPPYAANVPFKARAHVYRRRRVKDAALMVLLEYAGEWKALSEYPNDDVSAESAAQFAQIAQDAAIALAQRVWFNEADPKRQVAEAIDARFKNTLQEVRPRFV